jgi:hypothetical protein
VADIVRLVVMERCEASVARRRGVWIWRTVMLRTSAPTAVRGVEEVRIVLHCMSPCIEEISMWPFWSGQEGLTHARSCSSRQDTFQHILIR